MTRSPRPEDRRPYPTAPGPTKPSPATAPRRRAPSPDAGRIPATVWACHTPATLDADATWHASTVRAIVTSFSTPRSSVVLLRWPNPAPSTAAPRHPSSDIPADNRPLSRALNAVTASGRSGQILSTTARPDHGAAAVERPDPIEPRGTADLVITSVHPDLVAADTCDRVTAAAAGLLRVGGILVVATHSGSAQGHLLDPTGTVVSSAQSADLLYLQHIVTLLAPIRHGRLSWPLAPHGDDENARFQHRAAVRGLPIPHQRIHADLLVFAQPHDHAAPPITPTTTATDTRIGQ